MERFLLKVIATALAVLALSRYAPTLVTADGLESALVFALVLGVLNAVVTPVLRLLTFPLTLLTLGLFTLVLNAIVFWLATLAPTGVQAGGFVGAFVGALVVSVVSAVAARLLG